MTPAKPCALCVMEKRMAFLTAASEEFSSTQIVAYKKRLLKGRAGSLAQRCSIFHRIVGSRNKRAWISQFQPLAQHLANFKVAESLVPSSLKYLQGWRLHSLSGPLVQGCVVLREIVFSFVSIFNGRISLVECWACCIQGQPDSAPPQPH